MFNSDIIMLLKGKKVLDLGCGVGDMLDYGTEGSLGVDGDRTVVSKARKLGRNVIYGKLPDVTFNGKFEVVVLSHILEHLSTPEDVQKTVRLAWVHLNEGGLLIVGTPYAYDEGALDTWQHRQVFTMGSLTELIQSQGFIIEEAYSYWHVPAGLVARGLISSWPFRLTRREYFLKLLATFGLIRHLTVTARKLERAGR